MARAAQEVWSGFGVQRHAIAAIMRREFVLRWGRRNLGFAWLFAEPLIFAFPVITIWTLVRAPFEHGLPMTAFVWSGYMPLLIFRHVTMGAIFTIRQNVGLLFHRRVSPFDIFLGRQGLEALGNLASVAFSFFVLHIFGFLDWPYDYTLFVLGFVYTAWWSLAVALILASLSERWEVIPHIWSPIAYLYIWFSGFLFMAAWVPPNIRAIILAIDPPFICYEIERAGLFGPRLQFYYDIPYLTYVLLILTAIGLWLMHHVRKHLELE